MSRLGRALALLVAIPLVAVACTSGEAAPPTGSTTGGATGPTPAPSASPSASGAPSPSPSASSGDVSLLVQVTSEGGFIGPAARIVTLPMVSVSSDGRILVPAPVTMQYPGGLVPPFTVRDVGPSGAAAIRAAIADAGLDTADYVDPSPGTPDAGQIVFTVRVDGRTVTSRFNGLGLGGVRVGVPGPSASPDVRKVVAAKLLDRLTTAADAWGGATPPTETRYVPEAYRIWVVPGAPQADGGLEQPSIAWPLATPLASFGRPAPTNLGIAGLRVGVVSGADAATLRPILESATEISPFTSNGETFTLKVRPILPGEATK